VLCNDVSELLKIQFREPLPQQRLTLSSKVYWIDNGGRAPATFSPSFSCRRSIASNRSRFCTQRLLDFVPKTIVSFSLGDDRIDEC